MKVNILTATASPFDDPRPGNVYPVGGGYGRKQGHMMILLHVTDSGRALFLIVDKQGVPQGVTHYGEHVIIDRQPIAFVDGLEDLEFEMRSI
ncbi:hypothetical protein [uncultured Amaricoccus sp.]|uniref:hypothetical protein n=1 Tax=uncultured Amaricoccus sp. TaxID=339341 RepID=UPI00261DFEFD|nr:hypothetical protein [uncultured Amaricoccus sp.]